MAIDYTKNGALTSWLEVDVIKSRNSVHGKTSLLLEPIDYVLTGNCSHGLRPLAMEGQYERHHVRELPVHAIQVLTLDSVRLSISRS